jgi:hypothetical protein
MMRGEALFIWERRFKWWPWELLIKRRVLQVPRVKYLDRVLLIEIILDMGVKLGMKRF